MQHASDHGDHGGSSIGDPGGDLPIVRLTPERAGFTPARSLHTHGFSLDFGGLTPSGARTVEAFGETMGAGAARPGKTWCFDCGTISVCFCQINHEVSEMHMTFSGASDAFKQFQQQNWSPQVRMVGQALRGRSQ